MLRDIANRRQIALACPESRSKAQLSIHYIGRPPRRLGLVIKSEDSYWQSELIKFTNVHEMSQLSQMQSLISY